MQSPTRKSTCHCRMRRPHICLAQGYSDRRQYHRREVPLPPDTCQSNRIRSTPVRTRRWEWRSPSPPPRYDGSTGQRINTREQRVFDAWDTERRECVAKALEMCHADPIARDAQLRSVLDALTALTLSLIHI